MFSVRRISSDLKPKAMGRRHFADGFAGAGLRAGLRHLARPKRAGKARRQLRVDDGTAIGVKIGVAMLG